MEHGSWPSETILNAKDGWETQSRRGMEVTEGELGPARDTSGTLRELALTIGDGKTEESSAKSTKAERKVAVLREATSTSCRPVVNTISPAPHGPFHPSSFHPAAICRSGEGWQSPKLPVDDGCEHARVVQRAAQSGAVTRQTTKTAASTAWKESRGRRRFFHGMRGRYGLPQRASRAVCSVQFLAAETRGQSNFLWQSA